MLQSPQIDELTGYRTRSKKFQIFCLRRQVKLCEQPVIRQRTNSRATLVDQGPRRPSWFGFRLTNSPASPYSARLFRQHHVTLSRLLALYQEGATGPLWRIRAIHPC